MRDPQFSATRSRDRLAPLAGAWLAGVAYTFLRRIR
jgi:hypothetical protein